MSDLWNLVWGKPQVDPNDLAVAIEQEAVRTNLDFRTRILIKDSTEALEKYWGNQRLSRWLGSSKARQQIEAIRKEELGETGFPSLKDRIMEKTHPKTIEQFFRDLGSHLAKSVTIQVGGSVALIMTGALSRATEDIDVVDEVPAEIRHLRPLLDQLTQRYGIRLAHFQS
ncbi:MAG TPA: hypothetical protein VGY77_00210, partial [Gemmataceae bacterium]|nr:hypothetical protein [Gemmataceae bacterium]